MPQMLCSREGRPHLRRKIQRGGAFLSVGILTDWCN